MGSTDADRPTRRATRPISPGGLLALVLALGVCWGCASAGSAQGASAGSADGFSAAGPDSRPADVPAEAASAVFAGGCFWCVEAGFDKAHVDGIYEAESGYTGGDVERPTYEQVSSGGTGHVESVRVWYDPKKVGYDRLLDIFWRLIDPTDDGGQFADRGSQYRTAIFVADAAERSAAEASKKRMEASGRFDGPIVTEIRDAGPFWPAETYHQDYYRKHPAQYKSYRFASGRTPYLERIWGAEADESDHAPVTDPAPADPAPADAGRADWRNFTMPDDATLHDRLSDLQYRVTQQEGTEPPFDNEYWDNHAAGIYVDVVSGEPLFSSKDKYDSGTGWPSFIKPIAPDNVVEKVDRNLGMARTEVRSKRAGSHLGHVFNDGPAPTGLRYCMNSAALRFIPVEDLEKEGYGEYRKLFD